MRLLLSLLTILVAGTLLVAGGCARKSTSASSAVAAKSLLVGNGAEPTDLDPPVTTAFTDMNIIMSLFEGLTFIDEQSTKPVPAAAERWETTPDGLTWTFHLRPNARWSNGEPVTADDFVQSFRRTVSPAMGLENASYLFPLKNAEAINAKKPVAPLPSHLATPEGLGCAAPDAHTLVLTLERPTPHLPLLTALTPWYPINPRVLTKFDALARRGTAWTRAGNLVGNGAFTLVEWSPQSRIVVARNPHYWNATETGLERITFFPNESYETDERNFRAGQLHVTYSLPVAKVAAWRARDPNKLRIDPFLQTVFVMFNTRQAPFDDVRVRQAFSLAIDREAIARTALGGSRPPAFSATPPGTGGYTARAKVGRDVAKARELFAVSGHANGAGMPKLTLQVKNDEVQTTVAEALQAMWREALGVEVSLSPMEQKTWLQNQQTLNYTLSTYSWIGDFPDPLTFLGNFTANNGNNWTGWSDPAYDALVTEATTTIDPAKRAELFQHAEAKLLELMPVSPVYHGAQTYLIDPAVKNWTPALLGSRRYQRVRLGD